MDVAILPVKLMSASCGNMLNLNCQFRLIKPHLMLLTKRLYEHGFVIERASNAPRCGARLSVPVQTGAEAHPASCKCVLGLFPGGKAAGAWLAFVACVQHSTKCVLNVMISINLRGMLTTVDLPSPFQDTNSPSVTSEYGSIGCFIPIWPISACPTL
jgi:hypothetical protein